MNILTKVLILGSGGREHMIGKQLCLDNRTVLHCIGPTKNPGLWDLCDHGNRYHLLQKGSDLDSPTSVVHYCVSVWQIELVIIGPEAYLIDGYADVFRQAGVAVIGPGQELAKLESSKLFTRQLLNRCPELAKYNPHYVELRPNNYLAERGVELQTVDVETLLSRDLAYFFSDGLVVKADGLRGGKGVKVYQTGSKENIVEAVEYILQLWGEDSICLLEEKLVGEEFSLMSFCDGQTLIHLPPIQDYKRLGEGDAGPNTGGMGCVLMEQLPFLTEEDVKIAQGINEKVVAELQKKVHSVDNHRKLFHQYCGIVYGSFMKTNDGELKVIEYNARFGDPEVLLALSAIDWSASGCSLLEVFNAMNQVSLKNIQLQFKPKYEAVCVYLCPPGYPVNSLKGQQLENILPNCILHDLICASINLENDSSWLTGGSRIGALITSDQNLESARTQMIELLDDLPKQDLVFRRDIGQRLADMQLAKASAEIVTVKTPLTYEQAGVNLTEADRVVKGIKEMVEMTHGDLVVKNYGGFGGLYNLATPESDILISSIDGIGTKYRTVLGLIESQGIDRLKAFESLGHDLFNLNLNDILVAGRHVRPITFLDYFGCHHLVANEVKAFIKGIVCECLGVGCALIGGETSEKPLGSKGQKLDSNLTDVVNNQYEMVGVINGIVCGYDLFEKDQIKVGDLVIGLASSGPHTNGYSLINRLLEKGRLNGDQWFEELCQPHRNYYRVITHLINRWEKHIHGLCHITGGGLVENPPRILPKGVKFQLDKDSWEWPEVFRAIQSASGGISDDEMLKTFNCGLGMLVVVDANLVEEIAEFLDSCDEEYWLVGKIVKD